MIHAPPAGRASADEDKAKPRGEMITRMLAMPADANPHGDIFGGWVLGQMDVAGGIAAALRAKGRVATVAVTGMAFHKPVLVGDVVACHADIERIGTTSITIHVEVWILRGGAAARRIKVTEGVFTYVALDEKGQKRPVPPA
ncbi:MAG: acyl-CoA thioesterase [Pseudomonadota bacterium]